MDNYVIVTDSCADLTIELVQETGVMVIPLTVTINNKTYYNYPDERELNLKEFYGMMRAGSMPSTSLINEHRFLEAFRPILAGGKDLLYLGFDSTLSGTVGQAFSAAEELKTEFPERKIVVVDTLSASMGFGLLVYYAANMKKEGSSIEEVAEWVDDNRLSFVHLFTVENLTTLKRGGRISGATAILANLFDIKPVLYTDNEGRLVSLQKTRGRKKSLLTMVELSKERLTADFAKDQVIFIGHADDEEMAHFLGDKFAETFHPKKIVYGHIGPVIGAHSGPGTIALFFRGTHR